jgi:hypothetical protein
VVIQSRFTHLCHLPRQPAQRTLRIVRTQRTLHRALLVPFDVRNLRTLRTAESARQPDKPQFARFARFAHSADPTGKSRSQSNQDHSSQTSHISHDSQNQQKKTECEACRRSQPSRSCGVRCLLKCALRWWQHTPHHRSPSRQSVGHNSGYGSYCHSQAPQSCRCATSTIAAMCSCQSLCLVATTHHRFTLFVSFVGSVSGHGCCPAQAPQSCRLVCLAVVVIARCGNTLRFYITPHCIKCMPVSRQAPLVVMHRWRALSGLRSRRYAKLPTLAAVASCRRSPVASRPTRRHLSPCGCACMVASVRRFAQCFSVSGFAVSLGVGPRPPLGSLASQASPARSARPPPKGAPSEPRKESTHDSPLCVEPCATSKIMQKLAHLPQMGDARQWGTRHFATQSQRHLKKKRPPKR